MYAKALLQIWEALPTPVNIACPPSKEEGIRKMLSKEKVMQSKTNYLMRNFKLCFRYINEREVLEVRLAELSR